MGRVKRESQAGWCEPVDWAPRPNRFAPKSIRAQVDSRLDTMMLVLAHRSTGLTLGIPPRRGLGVTAIEVSSCRKQLDRRASAYC